MLMLTYELEKDVAECLASLMKDITTMSERNYLLGFVWLQELRGIAKQSNNEMRSTL